MRIFTGVLVILIFAALAWYFFREGPRNTDALQAVVERKFENANFVWLVQSGSFFNEMYRVVLVFGYEDNLAACLEMAEDNERRYARSQYSCEVVGN